MRTTVVKNFRLEGDRLTAGSLFTTWMIDGAVLGLNELSPE